jgi:hypothetical protein
MTLPLDGVVNRRMKSLVMPSNQIRRYIISTRACHPERSPDAVQSGRSRRISSHWGLPPKSLSSMGIFTEKKIPNPHSTNHHTPTDPRTSWEFVRRTSCAEPPPSIGKVYWKKIIAFIYSSDEVFVQSLFNQNHLSRLHETGGGQPVEIDTAGQV